MAVRSSLWGGVSACGGLPGRLVRDFVAPIRRATSPPQPGRLPHERGQSTIEFAISWSAVLVPMVFAVIYTAQLLWIWHSVNDYTRRGAGYASTHCWMSSGSNVIEYMRNNVPAMVNQDQFQSGPVEITVSYFGKDPDTGQLTPFSCDSDCSASCIPDTVSVSVTGFEYRTFVSSLGLPPIIMPDFKTSVPMESAGCDPDTAECLP